MPAESRRRLATDAWGALLRVQAAVVPALDRELREHAGLSLAWYDVLLELRFAEGGALTTSELGERAVLSRSRLSRVVDEMTDAGLVTRTPHPTDGRAFLVEATPDGRAAFDRAAPVYVEGVDRRFGRALPRDGLRDLRDALEEILDLARAEQDPPSR